jgi:hypothetical protein
MSQILLSCTSPGVRPYISPQKWNSYALFCQDKDAHIGYSPSYIVYFAFIYFCYSILTTLWNKVNSNFDPAYFLLVIRCFEYFSPHFSPAFIRFHHRVSMNGEMTNVIFHKRRNNTRVPVLWRLLNLRHPQVRFKSYPTKQCLVGYDLILTLGCHRFYYLAPVPVLDQSLHEWWNN